MCLSPHSSGSWLIFDLNVIFLQHLHIPRGPNKDLSISVLRSCPSPDLFDRDLLRFIIIQHRTSPSAQLFHTDQNAPSKLVPFGLNPSQGFLSTYLTKCLLNAVKVPATAAFSHIQDCYLYGSVASISRGCASQCYKIDLICLHDVFVSL